MNWVGGKLHRHSKTNSKPAKARQREYFAKQKGKLSSQSLSYFENFKPDFLSPAKSSSQRKCLQQKLEEFESVAPVANRLGSMRSKASMGLQRRTAKQHSQTKIDLTPRRTHDAQSGGGSHHQEIGQGVPSPLEAAAQPGSPEKSLDRAQWLKEQRNKLLAQDDWAGLRATRPLQMSFISDAERAMIGKRRKINADGGSTWPTRRIQHATSRSAESSPMWGHASPRNRRAEDISVRIGMNALDSTQHMSQADSMAFGSLRSTESMLLDNESRHWPGAFGLPRSGFVPEAPVQEFQDQYTHYHHLAEESRPISRSPSSISWVYTQCSPTPLGQGFAPLLDWRNPTAAPGYVKAEYVEDRPYTGYVVSEEEENATVRSTAIFS